MRSVQSLVIPASMKQIVPLIAVKMWCRNPRRYAKCSSHRHGFILRYSQAEHTWWEIIIEGGKTWFTFISFFLFDLALGLQEISLPLYFCRQTGRNEMPLFDLKLVNGFSYKKQNISLPAMLPLKWPLSGTNTYPFWCRISDRTLSITSEYPESKVRKNRGSSRSVWRQKEDFGEGRGPEVSRVFLIFLILLVCHWYRREREWRRETSGDECMRYDEIRNEGGGEKRQDELLMAQQVWSSLGNTGAREEGRSPICKGQREGQCVCTYIYHMCVAGAHRAPCSTTHNSSPLWVLPSMSQLPIHMQGPILSTCVPVRSKQWQGRLCHYEMHSWQVILLMYHRICSYAGERVLNYLVGLVEEQLNSTTHGEQLSINNSFCSQCRECVYLCGSEWLNKFSMSVAFFCIFLFFFFKVNGSSSLLSQVAVSWFSTADLILCLRINTVSQIKDMLIRDLFVKWKSTENINAVDGNIFSDHL